jgi:hypothetical protein
VTTSEAPVGARPLCQSRKPTGGRHPARLHRNLAEALCLTAHIDCIVKPFSPAELSVCIRTGAQAGRQSAAVAEDLLR